MAAVAVAVLGMQAVVLAAREVAETQTAVVVLPTQVVVALAVAETASTAASPDTYPGSARNPRSLERPGDLEADQVGATESAPEE